MNITDKSVLQYANHFYNQVKLNNELEHTIRDVKQILNGIRNKDTFRQLLQLEHVALADKKQMLGTVLEDISDTTKDYVAPYLTPEGLGYLVAALESFLSICNSAKLEIVTAVPLTQEQIDRIAHAFQKRTQKEYDTWINVVDESVIGGVLLRTKNYMLDNTIKAKLVQFNKEMKG